jgi:hypothetical protein
MISLKISFKIIYKNIFLNLYIYIIDILLFFIKKNNKKKFNKNTKSNLKIFKKNNWFSQNVRMFDISLVEGYVLIYFYNDFYYKN